MSLVGIRRHTCDQMVCTHVQRAETTPVFVFTDECDKLVARARDGWPGDSGSFAQVTVRMVEIGLPDLELELDLASCTPRDVICHLLSEGAVRREAPAGTPNRFGVAWRGKFLAADAPLVFAGVTDGDLLEVHQAMVV